MTKRLSWLIYLGLIAASIAGCKEAEKTITGVVNLDQSLSAKVSPSAVLFIIARTANSAGGAPIAVKRFIQPFSFPLSFSITAQDRMMTDVPFEGKMTVTARIAQSGSATPVSPGDIEGQATPNPAEPGEAKVQIDLSHVR